MSSACGPKPGTQRPVAPVASVATGSGFGAGSAGSAGRSRDSSGPSGIPLTTLPRGEMLDSMAHITQIYTYTQYCVYIYT